VVDEGVHGLPQRSMSSGAPSRGVNWPVVMIQATRL
jgi:hypothetical protein